VTCGRGRIGWRRWKLGDEEGDREACLYLTRTCTTRSLGKPRECFVTNNPLAILSRDIPGGSRTYALVKICTVAVVWWVPRQRPAWQIQPQLLFLVW
jgi:hypothetical protein